MITQLFTFEEVVEVTFLPQSFPQDIINKILLKVQETLLYQLIPNKMYNQLIDGLVGMPELQAFRDDYLKYYVGWEAYLDATINSQAIVTNAGLRVRNENYSTEADAAMLAQVQANNKNNIEAFRRRLVEKYESVNYVFDGVSYPPEINMVDYWDGNRFINNGRFGYYSNGVFAWDSPIPANSFNNRNFSIRGI